MLNDDKMKSELLYKKHSEEQASQIKEYNSKSL